MKVTRAGGTCLLVMLAIVAFAATSASASLYEVKGLPEMGRCVKTALGQGTYIGGNCISVAKPGAGRYEFIPASATEKLTFTGAGNESTLTTVGHPTIKCAATNIKGEWRGPKVATVEIEFQACKNALEEPCQSTPPNKTEIKTFPLEGELGFIKNQVKEGKLTVNVGLDLKPQEPTTKLATFECGSTVTGNTQSLEGSVIGEIKPINRMTTLSNLVFRLRSNGEQYPSSFEGLPEDTLTSAFQTGLATTFAPSTLKVKEETGHNSSALEIKAKETPAS